MTPPPVSAAPPAPASSAARTPLPCAPGLEGSPLDLARAGLDACVHCGFCLPACPTYVQLQDENDSPRGRLVLMRRLLEGALPADDPSVGAHLDRCLGCRGCETACPSGVPYGALLEATRATLAPVRGRPWVLRAVLGAFRRPALMRVVWWGARVLRGTGVAGWLAPRLPQRLGFPLGMLAATTPAPRLAMRRGAPASPPPGAAPAVLLSGCVMDGLFGHVHDATRRVLAHHGVACATPSGQQCCGALHAHAGDLEGARALARANIAAFEGSAPAPIVVNSAGCGAMLKQYGHLLHDDAAWHARAEAVAARTRDVSELLAAHGVRGGGAAVPWRVAHDPPCHQMHAQQVVRPPEQLLAAVPGLRRAPLADADQCCGSAGIYTLVEPEVAQVVLGAKLTQLAASGAEVVATGNPGCHMHIGAGLLLQGAVQGGQPVTVVHPVELLDASYGGVAS